LKVEAKRFVSVFAKGSPNFGFRTLNVIIGGKNVAGVEVPMFVPGKSSLPGMVN
jgi:hypothetical protein